MLTGVGSKIDKNAKIIVACSAGGTMKPTQNLPEGQQSRWILSILPVFFSFEISLQCTIDYRQLQHVHYTKFKIFFSKKIQNLKYIKMRIIQ